MYVFDKIGTYTNEKLKELLSFSKVSPINLCKSVFFFSIRLNKYRGETFSIIDVFYKYRMLC